MDVGTLRQALSVLLVFVLLGLVLWKLRRPGRNASSPWRQLWRSAGRGAAAESRSLESLERLALTPQHALHLVRVQGREVLVATHPQGCTLISEHAKGAGA